MSAISKIADYVKTVWKAGKSGGTAWTPERLNNAEDGIELNRNTINTIITETNSLDTSVSKLEKGVTVAVGDGEVGTTIGSVEDDIALNSISGGSISLTSSGTISITTDDELVIESSHGTLELKSNTSTAVNSEDEILLNSYVNGSSTGSYLDLAESDVTLVAPNGELHLNGQGSTGYVTIYGHSNKESISVGDEGKIVIESSGDIEFKTDKYSTSVNKLMQLIQI